MARKKVIFKSQRYQNKGGKTYEQPISRIYFFGRQRISGNVGHVKIERRKAVAKSLSETFKKVNQVVRGWINYFRIGTMKKFLEEFGTWLRHKIRVIIVKQWKRPFRIYANLQRINQKMKYGFSEEDIYKVANTRRGLYAQCNGNVINFILNPKILSMKNGDRPGLVNPIEYYLIGRQK